MKNNLNIEDIALEEFLQLIKADDCIEIYTDGSCLGNPGPGGWAGVLIFKDKRTNISGYVEQTTNNRMELIAAIESVRIVPVFVRLILYTDSTYLKNGITQWIKKWENNNWKSSSGGAVKNQDLWKLLIQTTADRNIEWTWVKGHADCTNNNNADLVARSAIISSFLQ
jgi:ribonuclease HI